MNKVRVFGLQHLPNEVSPWRVKWTINGKPKTRAKRTKAEAELLRSKLIAASAAGEPFDLVSGEPASWSQTTMTFADVAALYSTRKWPRWSAASRRSFVDAVSVSVAALVSPKVKNRPDPTVLSTALRCFVLVPEASRKDEPAPDVAAAMSWMERASLPLALVTVDEVEAALERCNTKLDGGTVATATFTRRRQALHAVLEFSVRRKYLRENPLDSSDWQAESPSIEVDRRLVLSPDQCRLAADALKKLSPAAARFYPFVSVLWLAGLRPSEAAHLKVKNLTLPETGWGRIEVTGAAVEVGGRWTDTGERADIKGLKWRKQGAVREVPIPPELVKILRGHVNQNNLKDNDLLFTAARGGTLASSSIHRYWDQALEVVFPQGDPLRDTSVAWLRHTNGSILLEAGVNPVEVARRLGHSPDVLLRIYAGVMRGFEEQANARVDSLLGTNT